MNPYIMLGIAILLLIGAILRQIDWRKYALKWVGYKENRARVYVKYGSQVKPYEGKQDKDNILLYSWMEEKAKKTILLPANYPHLNIQGFRIIGVENGLAVASPLGFMGQQELRDYKEYIKESGASVEALIHSDIVIKVLKSITNTKPFNWTMLIIIGVVAVAGLWWYSNQHKVASPGVTSNQTQTLQKANSDNLILVIPPVRTVVP